MIVDVRTYTCKPRGLQPHLALYEKHGREAQLRHVGEPVAFLLAGEGELNCYTHLWAYESLADREKKRAVLAADPEWKEYLRVTGEAGNLVHQKNQLMVPASFWPLKR
jgi:hypothetical protein